MSRLERLLNLTAALLTATRPLTSADIRERVPGYPDASAEKAAFRRAFERDKAALRDMGIPLLVEDLPGTEPPEQGYRIRREDYALRDPGLAADEMAAVHLAIAAVRMDGLGGEGALWKLGGAPDDTAGLTPPVAALPAIQQLVPLFGAVAARSTVTFGYRGDRRTVQPWRLSFSRGHWYLDGHDIDRGAERQFRLDRIDGDVESGPAGSFDRPEHLVARTTRQPWEVGGDEPVVARLAVDADQAGWAVDQLVGATEVARHDDGSVELEVTVSNRDAFRSFVLGFLDHAELLSPPELRADMVEWLQACRGGRTDA